MTREDSIKWLENLKEAMGQSQYQGLWVYEQALAETIELLQNDRLVELPCKVGRFVYADARLFCTDCLKEEVRKSDYICCAVVNVRYDKNMKSLIYLRPLYRRDFDSRYHIFVLSSAIGKTVFLTKEEAEAKLKEIEND
nr:MAG TPA: hypothetical protein [Caudoviricetes sp.]